jgi:hypothetical protein
MFRASACGELPPPAGGAAEIRHFDLFWGKFPDLAVNLDRSLTESVKKLTES